MCQLKRLFNNKDILQRLSCLCWLWRHCEGSRFPLAILLLLDVTVSVMQVWVAFLSRDLIDSAIAGAMRRLAVTAAFFIAGTLLVALLGSLRSNFTKNGLEQYSNGLREDLFERMIRADWPKISRYHPDDLLSRLTEDVKAIGNGLLSHIPNIMALLIQVVVAFTALAIFEPGLAIAALIMVPITSLSSRNVGKRTGHLRETLQTLEDRFRFLMRETLGNLPTVKAFCLEKASHAKLHAIHQSRMEYVRKSLKMGVAAEMMLSVRDWGGYTLTLIWGAVRLAVGTTTLGSVLGYIQLVEKIQKPFVSLEGMMPTIIGTFAAVNRVMELDALTEEDNKSTPTQLTNTMEEVDGEVAFASHSPFVVFGDDVKTRAETDAAGQKNGNIRADDRTDDDIVAAIAFQHVSCRYEDNEESSKFPNDGYILKKTDIRFERGTITAVTGLSDIGKTTMIRILLALICPDSGIAYWEDVIGNLHRLRPSSRRLFSYASYGNTLMSGTIRENITCGHPDATDVEIKQAAGDAEIDVFIEGLEKKYESQIGDNGLFLSESQYQRIAIARALVARAPVLILDGATSALDAAAETRILANIMQRRPKLICILATHRAAVP